MPGRISWDVWRVNALNALFLLSSPSLSSPSSPLPILLLLTLLSLLFPSPPLFFFLMFIFFIQKAEKGLGQEVFYLLVHSPSGCNGQGWARLSQEPRTPVISPTRGTAAGSRQEGTVCHPAGRRREVRYPAEYLEGFLSACFLSLYHLKIGNLKSENRDFSSGSLGCYIGKDTSAQFYACAQLRLQ